MPTGWVNVSATMKIALLVFALVTTGAWACSTQAEHVIVRGKLVIRNTQWGGTEASLEQCGTWTTLAIRARGPAPRYCTRAEVAGETWALFESLQGETLVAEGRVMIGCSSTPHGFSRLDALLGPKGKMKATAAAIQVGVPPLDRARVMRWGFVAALACLVAAWGRWRALRVLGWVGLVAIVGWPLRLAVLGDRTVVPQSGIVRLHEDPQVFYRQALWLPMAKHMGKSPAELEKAGIKALLRGDEFGQPFDEGKGKCKLAYLGKADASIYEDTLVLVDDELFRDLAK